MLEKLYWDRQQHLINATVNTETKSDGKVVGGGGGATIIILYVLDILSVLNGI